MTRFAERGGWWVAAQAALLGAVIVAILAFGADWGMGSRIGGWSLAGLGAVMAGWGLVSLGSNLTPYPHPLPHAETVAHGPYRLVRHPIYGGIVLGAAGFGVGDGNVLVIGLAVALLVLFTGKSAFEEQRLLAHDPAYGDYREQVTRLMIPWLW